MKYTNHAAIFVAAFAMTGFSKGAAFFDDFSADTSANYIGTRTFGSGSPSFNVSGGTLNVVNTGNQTDNVFHSTAQLEAGEYVRVTVPVGTRTNLRLTVSTTTRGPNTGTEDGIRYLFYSNSTSELRTEVYRDGVVTSTSYFGVPTGWTGDLTMYVFRDTNTSYRVGYDTGSGVSIVGPAITINETSGASGLYIGVEGYATATRRFDNLEIQNISGLGAPFVITNLDHDSATGTSVLTWNSKPGANYVLEFSTTLLAPWIEINGNIPSQGETTTFESTIPGEPLGFYRVKRAF